MDWGVVEGAEEWAEEGEEPIPSKPFAPGGREVRKIRSYAWDRVVFKY